MLAILRLGGTYVPLDKKNGTERLVGSVSIAKPNAILFDKWTKEELVLLEASNAIAVNVSEIETIAGSDRTPNKATPELNAAILFTSGSTGKPKGISLPHSCLSANAEGVERSWNVGANVVLQQITLSFDFSLHQIFTALANGGTLVIVPSDKRGKPAEITRMMLDEGVTHTLATPTEYNMWFQAGYDDLGRCMSWRWALSGGEALLKSTMRDFSSLGRTGLKLYDFYGPIEATIAITKGEVAYRNPSILKPGNQIPTSKILPNYSAYILDEKLSPLPVGIPGEIVVGGPAVAAGYLGLEEWTAEKFIQNPFLTQDKYAGAQGWDRLYRIGDRGRVNEQGQLFYEGRMDGETQVKILGVRTELGEIESAIMATSRGAINQAIVAQHGEASEKFLVAYVVMANPDEDAGARDKFLEYIQAALALPQFMRPSVFLPVTSIPVNSHGKTDRKALKGSVPIPSRSASATSGSDFGTETEKHLAHLWTSILPPLGNKKLESNSDFFRSSGNSMLLVKLQRLIKDELNAAPRIIDIMNASVLREMAKVVQSTAKTRDSGINWGAETAIPDNWASIAEAAIEKPVKKDNLTIVLTGATGYIGSHLLPSLAEDPNIAKILCLVRAASSVPASEKVTTVECDLAAPNLGLKQASFTELAESADVIVHLAANRAFWDGYEILKHVNVNATKELARMALARRVPLLFFSSGAARKYTSTQPPPSDGSDAYLSSKWVAETLLRETSRQFGLPLIVHTPMGLPVDTPPSADSKIMDAFLSSTELVGLRPSFDSFSGHIDIFDTAPFVAEVRRVVVNGQDEEITECTKEYNATARFNVETAREAVAANEAWAEMPTMDMLAWTGEAKKNGLPFVLASQDITIQKGNSTLFSRR